MAVLIAFFVMNFIDKGLKGPPFWSCEAPLALRPRGVPSSLRQWVLKWKETAMQGVWGAAAPQTLTTIYGHQKVSN